MCPWTNWILPALMQARNDTVSEPLYVICRSGGRGRQACERLLQAGYANVVNIEGGTMACIEAGLQVVRGKKTISLERQVHRRRITRAAGRCSRLVRASGIHRLVGLRRSRVGVRGHYRYLRDGDDPDPNALEPLQPGDEDLLHPLKPLSQIQGSRTMKLLIVGGVAGGASAAARARRLSETAEIVVFERGPDVSYANCGLPYYVGGEIIDRETLLVTTPGRLRTRFKLDVRTRTSVLSINRTAKKIRVRDLATEREYEKSYDKLILAPGAATASPDRGHRLAWHLHIEEPARRGPNQGTRG